MQRHTTMFLCLLLSISCLLLYTDLNKVLASETPPAITPTPAPTDAISYELICEESRPEGCPADTSNLAISWLVECGSACAPKRECNFVRHVNGIPDPTTTVTPTPIATSTPSFSNCGQAIGMDWRAGTIGCSGSQTYYYTYWEDGAWRNCAFRSASRRLIALRVALTLGDTSDLHTINNFNIGWQGDQGYGFDVIFYRCHSSNTNTCQSSANLTYTRASKSDLIANPIPHVDFVYSVAVNFHNVDVGAISDTSAEGVRNMIVLDDISFCSSKLIFAPTTPTPTPTLTPEPQQPTCTTDVERLFRVASVESCDVDDELITGWFKGNGDELTLNLVETDMPPLGASECFDYTLQHQVNIFKEPHEDIPIEFAVELSDSVYVTRVRADLDVQGDGMSEDQFTVVKVQLYRDRKVVYEDVVLGMDWMYLDTIDISVPNVFANGIGFSVPGYDALNDVDLFMMEAYGSLDLPVCGAGGDAPNDCQDPRQVDLSRNYVPDFTMKEMGRRCFTIIPKISIILSFSGVQVCFDLYRLPDIQLLTFTLPTTTIFHAMVAGYVLRNVMTR
jgi:hypothetical protein